MKDYLADSDARAGGSGERTVVGTVPWLPWPLSASRWWTEPVRAERLAALRIGLAVILLIDLLWTYLPNLHIFYGKGSLGDPALFDYHFKAPHWNWSLLRWMEPLLTPNLALVVWVVAAVFMLLGFWTRLSVVIVWVLSISFNTINDYNNNAGDDLRNITLFYLMFSPSGAVWSLDALAARWKHTSPKRKRGDPSLTLRACMRGLPGPMPMRGDPSLTLRACVKVYVPPWPLRLLLIQMALTYFCNGFFKIFGADWQKGNSLYYVLNDLTLARWSYGQLPMPMWMTRLSSWAVLSWELTFPFVLLLPGLISFLFGPYSLRLLKLPQRLGYLRQTGRLSPGKAAALRRLLRRPGVTSLFLLARYLRLAFLRLVPWLRRLRVLFLVFGVLFHLGIFITLELGFFGLYMIALYLPLVPWERWLGQRRPELVAVDKEAAPTADVELVDPAEVPLFNVIE